MSKEMRDRKGEAEGKGGKERGQKQRHREIPLLVVQTLSLPSHSTCHFRTTSLLTLPFPSDKLFLTINFLAIKMHIFASLHPTN